MIRIQEFLDKEQLRSSMILQVHDELNFDVVPEELDRLKTMVVREMETACTLQVPITVDWGEGANWLEAH